MSENTKIQISKSQSKITVLVIIILAIGYFGFYQPAQKVQEPQIAEASFDDRRAEKDLQIQKIQDEKARLELEAKKIELEKQVLEVEESLKVSGLENESSPQNPVKSIIDRLSHTFADNKTESTSKEQVQSYLNKYFPKSPITAQMIMESSQKSNIPVGFILAVGHNESHMGTKGRAVGTKNPFNVGNTDFGDGKAVKCGVANNCLNSWQDGLDAFTSLITQCYFDEGEQIKLQTWIDRDFRAVRCNIKGKRYMTDRRAKTKYAERIKNLKQLNIIY